MKLNRILVSTLMLVLMLLTSCQSNPMTVQKDGGNLTNTSWNYNYFYKNALYNFNFEFQEGNALKLTVTDNSILPDSGENRETTINGNYYTDGNVLSMELKSVKDPLNLVLTDLEDNSKVDLLYSIDSEDSMTLIRVDALFPVLPNEIVLNKVTVN